MLFMSDPTLPSPLDKAAPFQLSHPEINLPVFSLPDWNKFVFAVNEMDTTIQETGIVLTLLPNMTIRSCIPTPQIPTFSISETIGLFKQADRTLFEVFACQANHIIHNLPINIMDLQTELLDSWFQFDCHAQSIQDWKHTESLMVHELRNTEYLYLFCPLEGAGDSYWSQDELRQDIIEDSLIQEAFGITIDWDWETPVHCIPPQFYEILCTIHKGCGFDPYSTQIAEYLGLPLVVTGRGHSGLDEDIEDSELNSRSDSDSDYVSASEDV
ncbi:hypothetical protein C8J56DRAFT_79910 [Mycena floridula]|nr:hypothetical protein C8J56DRAFT_79910 [Mycena floridula]